MKHISIRQLLLMGGVHFVIMYFAMYAMVNTFDEIFINLNNFYMAALMTSPMLLLEIIMMGSMYDSKRNLTIIFLFSIFAFILAFIFIRQQTFIKDKEFVRSMVPHHSGAILMCRKAVIEDKELKNLCASIIKSQESEIEQMKNIYNRL